MTTITCINCPVGCRMQVTTAGGEVTNVEGHACKRGETYAKQEAVNPLRMVTAVILVKGSRMPLSVKTKNPIPKKDIENCMRQIEALDLSVPIALGQVLIENVCESGTEVIATKALF